MIELNIDPRRAEEFRNSHSQNDVEMVRKAISEAIEKGAVNGSIRGYYGEDTGFLIKVLIINEKDSLYVPYVPQDLHAALAALS